MRALFAYAAAAEAEGLAEALPRALELGVGKTSSALRLTEALVRRPPEAVVLFGVAGAYRRVGGLTVGELCLVVSDRFADEGAHDEDGRFVDLAQMGFGEVGPFRADPKLCARVREVLGPLREVEGATVSTCSANDELASAMTLRTHAAVETMEGAAVAMCCERFAVPWVAIRSISNLTGARSRADWNFAAAQLRIRQAVASLCRAGL